MTEKQAKVLIWVIESVVFLCAWIVLGAFINQQVDDKADAMQIFGALMYLFGRLQ